MQRKQDSRTAWLSRPALCRGAIALALSLSLSATGCLSPLNQHATALAAATAPVVEQATAAYSSANSIHNLRLDYEAVAAFDSTSPVYNPRTIRPLMSDQEIQVRLAVLTAFQAYVQSVVAIASGADSPALQAAAKSAGEHLSSLGSTLAPAIDSTFGIASAAASTSSSASTKGAAPLNPIAPAIQNGIGTAIDALAEFLINRKTKKELPPIVQAMDPRVKVLCELLASDIAILTGQEDRDYNFVINQQTLFLRTSTTLDPETRREQIMKLPEIVRQEQASSRLLTQLGGSLVRLELTHHAFAAAAQGNNPESLRQKLDDLEAAASEIGKFHLSLSANLSAK